MKYLTLALVGLAASGLFARTPGPYDSFGEPEQPQEPTKPNPDAFYDSLSTMNKEKFKQMSRPNQKAALQAFYSSCKGRNNCKGQGACQTSNHTCAGLNDCRGQGGPPVKDPNIAVEVQFQNQLDEREDLKDIPSPEQTTPNDFRYDEKE